MRPGYPRLGNARVTAELKIDHRIRELSMTIKTRFLHPRPAREIRGTRLAILDRGQVTEGTSTRDSHGGMLHGSKPWRRKREGGGRGAGGTRRRVPAHNPVQWQLIISHLPVFHLILPQPPHHPPAPHSTPLPLSPPPPPPGRAFHSSLILILFLYAQPRLLHTAELHVN